MRWARLLTSFYDVEADGFSLDDKRDPTEANDLPGCLEAWRNRDPTRDVDRTHKAFFVRAENIREANYDLSLSKYKVRARKAQAHDAPAIILDRIKKLNVDIVSELGELEKLLG
jgi:type I restriction enzyme M protein